MEINYKIINGNSYEELKKFPDNYFDSVVTDPPYGLGKEPNAEEVLKAWVEVGYLEVSGTGFMGNSWDSFVPQPLFWKEVFRVLKHGGHVVSFFGTRTYDWGVMAMRLAGFEIRDSLQYMYGCLSSDTEILTERGWVSYDQYRISKKESIFVYNLETDEYYLEQPEKWNEYSIKDTCYRIQSDNTDQIVSRNHRCLVEREGVLLFDFAENIAQEQQTSIPFLENVSSVYENISDVHKRTGKQKQSLRKGMFLQNNFAIKNRQKEADRTISYNKKNLSYMRKGFFSTQFFFKKCKNFNLFKKVQWVLSGSGLEETRTQRKGELVGGNKREISFSSNGREKFILERRNNISQKERLLFRSKTEICPMSERVYSNGEERWLYSGISVNHGETVRQTSIENGVCSSYRPQSNEQRHYEPNAICYEQGTQAIRMGKSYSTNLATFKPIEYQGIIFCPTVSTGAFVARRNGKIFITGNSGFPKSHNVSKAIDKMPKASSRLCEFSLILKQKREELGITINEADKLICNGSTMYNFIEGRNINGFLKIYPPNKEFYQKIKTHFNIEGWDDIVENNLEKVGSETGNFGFQSNGERWDEERDINKITTDQAKQWDGWGSALKPAVEPIVLARKPLDKGLNIAENVLKWGTGAINIDGCRVGSEQLSYTSTFKRMISNNIEQGYRPSDMENNGGEVEKNVTGRFPSNLLMSHHPDCECVGTKIANYGEETIEDWNCVDDCPIKILDEQSGESKGTIRKPNGKPILNVESGWNDNSMIDNTTRGHNDKGGASRFFYCAKTSKSEKNFGLAELNRGNLDFKSEQDLLGYHKIKMIKNNHPTVKPIKLMQYLARLVTPPNGKVLDPFNGSGTTGIACCLEGFEYTGIELSEEYCKISEARINAWSKVEKYEDYKKINDNLKNKSQTNLFD